MSVSRFVGSPFSLLLALALSPGALIAQAEPSAPETTPAGPEAPPEYLGFSQPRVDAAVAQELAAADKAIEAGDWKEVAKILDHLLGPSTDPASSPQIDGEGDRFVTADQILFSSVTLEVARRIEKLPPEAKAIWQEKRKLPSGATAASSAVAIPTELEGSCVLGRPDHAAWELAPESEWRPGGYTHWIHQLTNKRELKSSTPAKNAFYAYAPMQLVFAGNLAIGRSHQDLLALDRATGEVKWRVETDAPKEEQTVGDGKSGGFDSWRYFTDLGGWQLTVLPGQPASVVVIDKPGRGTTQNNKLTYRRNLLRAFDASTGNKLWQRGGPDDPDDVLRGLTMTGPPVIVDGKGDTLVVPATSDEGYYSLGMTHSGGLLWAKRVYTYVPERYEVLDEHMAHGAGLAAADGVVVGAPSQGLIFAISKRGETLWQTRYPSGVRLMPNSPRWGPGHPIISAGKAIAAPLDGDALIVCDVRTGALVWSKRFLAGYHALLGADGSRAFKIDETGRVTAYTLSDGTIAWTSEALGAPAGRGVVTSGRVYVSLQHALLVLNARDGTIVKRVKVWDERVPDPSPGNLFLSKGEIFLGAPWGYAKLEAYEETLASLDSLGIREQLLRKAMVSHALGNYEEALDSLRKVLASTSDEAARESLRTELFQIAQEAASTTKDLKFIQRVLSEPDLLPSKAHRTAFVLRSAELFEKESATEAAKLYREIVEDAAPDEVFLSPDGVYADVQAHASEALLRLVRSGRAQVLPEEDERVARSIQKAMESERPLERLLSLWLKRSHSGSAALAGASILGIARAAGDSTAVRNIADRLTSFDSRLEALRPGSESVEPERAPPPQGWVVSSPWARRFVGKAGGAELVSTAPGSDPLPGMLIAKNGTLALLDDAGKVLWKHERAGASDLTEAREKFPTPLFEPFVAHRVGASAVVFTPLGLTELVGLTREPEKVRSWLTLKHPLDQAAAGAETASGGSRTVRIVRGNTTITRTESNSPQAKVAVDMSANCFPFAAFDDAGNPFVADPGGDLFVFERRTGRLAFRDDAADTTASGEPAPSGGLVALECARPACVIVRDPRSRARLLVPTPSTPWRTIIVPGIAIVTDSQAGIQARMLPMLAGLPLDDGATPRALWRDAKPRGFPALVHADAEQVIAVEPGGKLSSRSLQSGHPRWSIPFPDSASPAAVFGLPTAESETGALVIAATKSFDPDGARGYVGQKVAQDLYFVCVTSSGEKRWEVKAADGGVAYSGARLIAPSGEWIILFNNKSKEWKTRAIVLDPEKGTVRNLFDLDLETKPSYPPPRVCATERGIAVGNGGVWALFTP